MKKPQGPYNPMNVLSMLKSKGVAVPVGTNFGKKASLVDAHGEALYEKLGVIETCPVLVLAFMNNSPAVPDDFHGVDKTGAALKAYVRPDGGVYLGTFQAHHEPDGMIVVFGDPAMRQSDAQRIAMHYRTQLMERYEGFKAAHDLGPFAGLPVAANVSAPAVSDQEMESP